MLLVFISNNLVYHTKNTTNLQRSPEIKQRLRPKGNFLIAIRHSTGI